MMRDDRFLTPAERGRRKLICKSIIDQIFRSEPHKNGGYRKKEICLSVELLKFYASKKVTRKPSLRGPR